MLPLYARLSAAEQHRVFAAARRTPGRAGHQRRRDVADRPRHPVRRRPRHGAHLALQPPAEGAAAADRGDQPGVGANQRAGRCGRVSDGICIRLYSEEDFLGRPEFTEPGDPAHQPGVGHPADDRARARRHRARSRSSSRRTGASVSDGVALLEELGALDPRAAGRAQAAHAARPQARAAAGRPAARPDGARGRPQRRAARGARHRRRAVDPGPARAPAGPPAGRRREAPPVRRRPVRLPRLPATCGATCGSSRRSCPAARSGGCAAASSCTTCGSASGRTCSASCARWPGRSASAPPASSPARRRPADRCTSRCSPACSPTSACGTPDKREYLGARGARFAIWPGSALFKKPPRWVMAAELVETTRLWGRDVGRDRARVGRAAGRAPGEAHLQRAALVGASSGAAMAYERVTLYGVPLVAGRKVAYGRIDPERLARPVHPARAGGGRVAHPPPVLPRQPGAARGRRGARAPGPAPRHPGRRRDARSRSTTSGVPADVVSARHFDAWWKKARREQPDLLTFDPAMLVRDDADAVSTGRLPGRLGAGRPRAAADLPVRAGHRGRRRDRARAADRAQPARPRRLRLAGARAAPATWSPR